MSATTQLKPEALAARIDVLIQRGQFDPAMRLIPAVAALAPERSLSSVLAVRLALAQNNHVKAAEALDTASAKWPEDGDLLRLRARFALTHGNFPVAAQAAAAAIIANSKDAEAKSLLGRALLAMGDSVQARICLYDAVAANPDDVPSILALAEASPEQASLLLASASARMPNNTALRTALIRTLLSLNEPEAAWQMAKAAQQANALDADGFVFAGHAAALLHDWPQARRSWQAALRLAPRHPSALYRLAADRARGPDRLDPAIIAMADNARAETFELAAMAGGTILPGRLRAALIAAGITGRALDLGCGTGLCAIATRDLSLLWDGAEASSRLAAITHKRSLYRKLHENDPIIFLNQAADQWQAIAFNFTAGLVRHLDGLFADLAAHLAPGGIAIGAIATARDVSGFGPFGCFEHTEAEARSSASAAGLTIKLGEPETWMTIDGLALQGWIVALRHP